MAGVAITTYSATTLESLETQMEAGLAAVTALTGYTYFIWTDPTSGVFHAQIHKLI